MPSNYVPLQAMEHPPGPVQTDDDLSSQSLNKDIRPTGNSRSGYTADGRAAGRFDEGEVDVVRSFKAFYQDHSDSNLFQPLSFRRAMVLIAMAFLWTASQIPLYFVSDGTSVADGTCQLTRETVRWH